MREPIDSLVYFVDLFLIAWVALQVPVVVEFFEAFCLAKVYYTRASSLFLAFR